MPDETGTELIRVTDRRSGAPVVQERAFPRDPGLANDTPDPLGTVGPETAPTTAAGAPIGAEPIIVDGDAMAAALPQKGLSPSPWAGLPSTWQPAWGAGGGIGAQRLAGRVSSVFTCVDLNGGALGSMPLTLSERGRPLDPDLYEWTENPEPRLYSGWDEFMQQAYASMGTRGDAFIHATDWDWDTFLPSRFMVLDPDQVTVQFDQDPTSRTYGQRTYYLGGQGELYGPDVLHLRYLTIPGHPNGLSPLQGAAGNLRSAAAMEQYGANLAERGGMTWAVIQSDQRVTPRQAELAREEWVRAGQERSGAPAVLPYGLKLDTLNLSPKDMALLELRVFDEQRITAAYGVPAFLLNLDQPGGMTYSNVTSLFDLHWRRLRPVGKRITNAIGSWALPRGRKLGLNASDYITPTLQERTPAYQAMNEGGALTTNEWRAIEGLPPLPVDQSDAASAATSPFANVGLPALIDAGIITPAEARQLLGLRKGDTGATVAAITAGSATLQ